MTYGLESDQDEFQVMRLPSNDHTRVPKLTQAALQRKLLNGNNYQSMKAPKLSHRGLHDIESLSQYHTTKLPSFKQKLTPPLRTSSLNWITEGVKVKEEPEIIEIEENTSDTDPAYDQFGEGLSDADIETEQTLIQRYFNLQTLSDSLLKKDLDEHEKLAGYFLTGKSTVAHFLGKCLYIVCKILL